MTDVLAARLAWLRRGSAVFIVVIHGLNVAAHCALGSGAERPWWFTLVDVDTEQNLPTWFSSGLLLCCAVAAWQMAKQYNSPVAVRGWRLVALLLGLVSADEVVCLHERLAAAALRWLAGRELASLWLWAGGAVLVASAGATLLPFLRSVPRRLRRRLLVSAGVYVFGALVLEVIGQQWAALHGWSNPTYWLLAALEELFEMTGAWLFLRLTTLALVESKQPNAAFRSN